MYQAHILYTLNLHNVVYQVYLNKTSFKKNKKICSKEFMCRKQNLDVQT